MTMKRKTATPKTPTQRKLEERARRRKAGLVPLEIWIPAMDAERVKRYVARLVAEEEYRKANA